MKKFKFSILAVMLLSQACKTSENDFDATGVFEATETIVSAETSGKILSFNVSEGDNLTSGQSVGAIDCDNLKLQKKQVLASEESLSLKKVSAGPQIEIFKEQLLTQMKQIAAQKQQIAVLNIEQNRLERLVKAEAAPRKQLDDINGQLGVLQKQMEVSQSQIGVIKQQIKSQEELEGISNGAVMSEKKPLVERQAQIENLIGKCNIINPVSGVVLVKYAETEEVTAPGKALYKIANLNQMFLRAYVTGSQLSKIKLNQVIKVRVDNGKEGYREMKGKITWISDKAEFTPKTIQTKDERQNLVYAIKVMVQNDGYLKIGMYGEIKL